MSKNVTVKDVIREAKEEIEQEEITASDREVVDKIETLVAELKGDGISGKDFNMYSTDELSRIAGSLALLKISLGEIMSKAQKNFKVNEEIIKLKKANTREMAYTNLKAKGLIKPKQDDIKDYIAKALFTDSVKGALQEEYFNRLSNNWWAIKVLLDAIFIRIQVLQGQKADESKGQDSVSYDLNR